MRFSKETLLVAVAAGGAALMGSHARAATTLDFVTGLDNSGGIPESYGDNAAGTPNIGLTWNNPLDETSVDGWDSFTDWDGRGEVGQADYNQQDPLSVTFTPDAGFGVFVTSFDLDEFAGGDDTVVSWSLIGTGFSGTVTALGAADNPADDVRRFTVNTGMTAGDAIVTPLVLQLTLDSGFGSYQAIDNLAFDQVVIPEPGTAVLALGGLGALAMRRKGK